MGRVVTARAMREYGKSLVETGPDILSSISARITSTCLVSPLVCESSCAAGASASPGMLNAARQRVDVRDGRSSPADAEMPDTGNGDFSDLNVGIGRIDD